MNALQLLGLEQEKAPPRLEPVSPAPAALWVVTLLAIGLLSGCATNEPRAADGTPKQATLSELSEGYALLYDLLSKEKQSGLLSIIKKESPELKSLLERIASTSKAAVKDLDTLSTLDPPVNLKASHLPRLEQAARASIDKETSTALLHSSGVDLEFTMVSSQLAGMNYAAHLARTLALADTNPVRQQFLRRTDRRFSELHGQVHKMMFTRYER